ncbi:hypothetical protein D0Z07_7401 [Hyphodiscus hymeniophilus]|uniref:Uncharacterized protein n=1 Tax=Hyphodiscus hymeniophilus TaxID=353542 RepID=A0A9P7AUC5_9HELO|nr:hypothetical protein D0Z07_7401 [Hyphodiscus hymeniophilus]
MHGKILQRARISWRRVDTDNAKDSTWLSLPSKPHLAHIFFSRLFDFVHLTAIQSYLLDQLKSFSPSISNSIASKQLGLLNGGFTAAQAITTFCCVGLGLSRTFEQAIAWRILAGAASGNGGIRDLARAFLLLPLSYNFAALLGPVLGAYLSNPVVNFPSLFGDGSRLGEKSGVVWMQRQPYALPALTSKRKKQKKGLRWRWPNLCSNSPLYGYGKISSNDEDACFDDFAVALHSPDSTEVEFVLEKDFSVAYWRLFTTRSVLSALLTQAIFDFHIGAFGCVWILFLCAPHGSMNPSNSENSGLNFSNGLGMSAREAGLATSIIGLVGVPLQLFFYPLIHNHLGTHNSYKIFSALFPLSYFLIPFLTLTQLSTTTSTGPLTWTSCLCASNDRGVK